MIAILDLDGVVWLAGDPILGSPEAIVRLRAGGYRPLFLTNNSNPTVAELVAKLARFGVTAELDDVVTSAQAAAGLVAPGEVALVCGGPGVVEALGARGAQVLRKGAADAVVVGFHRDFDYERLTVAFQAVHGGARLIGTNDDTTYPMPDGLVPGGGAILAAVAAAAGVPPIVAGKPYQPMADVVAARVGEGGLDGAVLIGDRPSTDGLMASRLGIPFVHVLSGVDEDASVVGVTPEFVAPDLAGAADLLLRR